MLQKDQKSKFGWQDEAKKLSKELAKDTSKQGFFGINMASTGAGKTRANAKIMYAIGSVTGRVRFNVALGLRTLTLQTGVEYRDKLKIEADDLAVLVGGGPIKQLFENDREKEEECSTGSESQEALLADLCVEYKKEFCENHSLSKWTKHDERIEKLLNAPVLVSTIDHLIPATEGTRGGRQIGPMLRLLTSDLVIDEPDDFGLEDLPALCRLINWVGMLGSRVLFSTATMPPSLSYALFKAYQSGWQQYAKVNVDGWNNKIECAWFDEFGCSSDSISDFEDFQKKHNNFSNKRVKNIRSKTKDKRKGYIVEMTSVKNDTSNDPIKTLANTIHENIISLHKNHFLDKDEKKISIGLVRMANINPLIAVVKELLKMDSPKDTLIHYCVYHSRYPLAMRSHIETRLDKLLKRKEVEAIWEQKEVKSILSEYPEINNHIFVVFASPIAEVGRDHDYDWAVVEPSSMRSIVQLSGRVLRHRDIEPDYKNVCILNQNYRDLCKKPIRFEKPGFETEQLKLNFQEKIKKLIPREQYEVISSIPKIELPEDKKKMNLIGLEQRAIATQLFGKNEKDSAGGAKVWWENNPSWCGEVQRQQRFRKSMRYEPYHLILENEDAQEKWEWKNENVYPVKFCEPTFHEIEKVELPDMNKGCKFWFNLDAKNIYTSLSQDLSRDLLEISRQFGGLQLIQYTEYEKYYYQPNLGVYKDI